MIAVLEDDQTAKLGIYREAEIKKGLLTMRVKELDMRGNYHSFVAFDMKSLGDLDINHRLILNGYRVSCW
jgi:hypothetical protein